MSGSSEIGRVAQQALISADGLAASKIEITHYRAYPDMAVLDELYQKPQGSPPPPFQPGSWLAFIFSKPSITDNLIEGHCLEALDASGQPTGEFWMKLKSAPALANAFGGEAPAGDPASLAQRAWLQHTSTRTELTFEQFLLPGGPEWLRSDPMRSGNMIRLPTVITPLDVIPRFAGHCYLKLLLPDHLLFSAETPNMAMLSGF